jgi:hypothetical protein
VGKGLNPWKAPRSGSLRSGTIFVNKLLYIIKFFRQSGKIKNNSLWLIKFTTGINIDT